MMMKIVLLSLAGQQFSLSVDQVRYILPDPILFPLVCLREGVSGVFLYENELIPLLDLLALPNLNMQGAVAGSEYVVVFQCEYGCVGLPVDSAVTIVDVEDGLLKDTDPESATAQEGQVFCFQGTKYPLLDLDAILARLPY